MQDFERLGRCGHREADDCRWGECNGATSQFSAECVGRCVCHEYLYFNSLCGPFNKAEGDLSSSLSVLAEQGVVVRVGPVLGPVLTICTFRLAYSPCFKSED